MKVDIQLQDPKCRVPLTKAEIRALVKTFVKEIRFEEEWLRLVARFHRPFTELSLYV